MAEKKLSKKALNKSFRNWAYGNLTCFSQEHMQTFGYLCAMLPLVEELYDTKEEQVHHLLFHKREANLDQYGIPGNLCMFHLNHGLYIFHPIVFLGPIAQ